jgi:membrane protease YdiL (CAAX protease family)
MKQRNPLAVFLLPIVTLGIYSWYWLVKTKGEMNKLGEHIPTAWIWLIPFVGAIWWYYEYSKGVEHVTGEKINWILAFVVLFLLSTIGQAIIQDSFNKVTVAPVAVGPVPATPPTFQAPIASTASEENTTQPQP